MNSVATERLGAGHMTIGSVFLTGQKDTRRTQVHRPEMKEAGEDVIYIYISIYIDTAFLTMAFSGETERAVFLSSSVLLLQKLRGHILSETLWLNSRR